MLLEREFDDLESLRRALLTEQDLEALEQKVQKISEELSQASAVVEESEKSLEAHKEKKPDGLDSDDVDLAQLEQAVEKLDTEYGEIREKLGAIRKDKEKEEEELARQRELKEEHRRLSRDFKTWNRVYKLIGTSQGKPFQKFAQSLNLRELVYRANEHLNKLSPRYSLKVIDGELDFQVVDENHPHSPRELSTLSGGETFLVSLAMALSLAEYRQGALRMETLLLDEGFGTLDQESLSDALNLLNNLHLDGARQVGLISHVDGLKERIPHRIHVQTLGGGKSQLDVLGPESL